jgi:threonine aldolase
VLPTSYVKKVKSICKKHKLRLHLDGARFLNAATFLKEDPAKMGADFDTISFCFSKGMGCPVGSVIVGTEQDIMFARIIRKILGGQMRQVGVLATCALQSLEDWKDKL